MEGHQGEMGQDLGALWQVPAADALPLVGMGMLQLVRGEWQLHKCAGTRRWVCLRGFICFQSREEQSQGRAEPDFIPASVRGSLPWTALLVPACPLPGSVRLCVTSSWGP